MIKSNHIIGVALVTLVALTSAAAPPPDKLQPTATTGSKIVDVNDYVNANLVLAFANNIGNLFYDAGSLLGRLNGFYYPYVSISDIWGGQYNKTVVFSSGIWLGGKVGGETRIAVAAYNSEFVPGPMSEGTYMPDWASNNRYRVYHLYRDSLASHPNLDYLEWPADLGAPVDQLGAPLCLGDQMLWTVYNDADADEHWNNAGSTRPLGIEIQQTVWSQFAYNDETVVYAKFKLYNKGSNQISDFYISYWADPDVGGSTDDLAGCDTIKNMFFGYNGRSEDATYGTRPPAWGGMVVAGPVVPSPGSTASFDGRSIPDYRNLGMTAFTKYVNGADPDGSQESYNYMTGLNRNGSPYVYNGRGLKYMVSGDPATGSGDVDSAYSDRRFIASFGPLSFNPGDSQQLVLKFAVGQGWSPSSSVEELKFLLAANPVLASCDSITANVSDYRWLNGADFEPRSQKWLSSITGGDIYGDGTFCAYDFIGSALSPAAFPDSFVRTEIRFSRTITQKAYRYVRPGYSYGGYFTVPFTVWDVEHNRQLNVAFVESDGSRVFDSTWGPDNVANYGGREYIFIFNSDYSGDDPENTPLKYSTRNLLGDAYSLDLLYAGLYAVADGHSLGELGDGQRLVLIPQSLNVNGPNDTLTFREVSPGDTVVQRIAAVCYSGGPGQVTLTSSAPSVFSVVRESPTLAQRKAAADRLLSGVAATEETEFARASMNDTSYSYKVIFVPPTHGEFKANLLLSDNYTGAIKRVVRLRGWGSASCCVGTTGNVDGDPTDAVDITDVNRLVDYLFATGLPSPCPEESDVDRSGNIDISDLIKLVDFLFYAGSLPSCP